jgi:hypothetical protein
MLSLLVLVLFAAVVIALGLVLGGAFLAVAIVLAALALIVWVVRVFWGRSDTTPEQTQSPPERVESPELLGPGGPDDPRAQSSA